MQGWCSIVKHHITALQGLLIHPGWNEVVPCCGDVHQMYQVVEGGGSDLGIDVTVIGQRYQSLREIMALPKHIHKPMLVDSHARLVNSYHFKRKDGDFCHKAVLSSVGRRWKILVLVLFSFSVVVEKTLDARLSKQLGLGTSHSFSLPDADQQVLWCSPPG